jgi:hypothetical protein
MGHELNPFRRRAEYKKESRPDNLRHIFYFKYKLYRIGSEMVQIPLKRLYKRHAGGIAACMPPTFFPG